MRRFLCCSARLGHDRGQAAAGLRFKPQAQTKSDHMLGLGVIVLFTQHTKEHRRAELRFVVSLCDFFWINIQAAPLKSRIQGRCPTGARRPRLASGPIFESRKLFQAGGALANHRKVLAKAMIVIYAEAAEDETRKYALKQKNMGKAEDYVLWTQVASIIARWQTGPSRHI